MKTSIFAPLKHREYRRLFFGQLFSDVGHWFDFLALQALIVYTWNLGPLANAAQLITFGIPWVVLGPFSGVWADRLPRRTVMMVCDLLRAVIVLGMIFAPNFYVLLVLIFLKSSVGTLFDPARQGAIRMTVPEDELLQAVSLSTVVNNTTKVIGPLLGGGVIALFGVRSPYVIEIVCFLISACFLAGLPALRNEPKATANQEHEAKATNDPKKSAFWAEFREGWQHIRSVRILYVSIMMGTGYMFINFLYDGQVSQWVHAIGEDVTAYGIIVSAIGLGSVVGTLVVGQWSSWKSNPLQFMALGGVLSGSFLTFIGLGGRGDIVLPLAAWWAICFVWGMFGPIGFIAFGYTQQVETPKELMGRVSSATGAIMSCNMLIAPLIGSTLMHKIGVGTVFALAGVLLVLFTGSCLIWVRRAKVLPTVVLQESKSTTA